MKNSSGYKPYYNAAGKQVPGVTTVIKNIGWSSEPLMWWANKVGREEGRNHRDVAEEAACVGNFAHLAMEADVKGEPFNIEELDLGPQQKVQIGVSWAAWLNFKQMVNLEFIAAEIEVVSERLQCGGRIDILVKAMGNLAILDLKTGNKVYESAIIQCTAYGDLWNETHPENQIAAIYILRVDKENGSWGFQYKPFDPPQVLEPARKAFFHARQLHDLKKHCKKLVG